MKKCLFRILTVILCLWLCLSAVSCGGVNPFPNGSDVESSSRREENDGIDNVPQETGTLDYALSNNGEYYTVIGYGTCTQAELTIPKTYENKPVYAIDKEAFLNCTSIKSVVIPEGVTFIGEKAFKGCTSLEMVQMPDGVCEIGNNAFEKCSSLTRIKLPEGLTELGYGAFIGCTNLVQVEIPSKLAVIRHNVFSKCYKLARVVIGTGVSEIQEYAFHNCYSLLEVENHSEYITVTADESNGEVGLYALNIGNCDDDFESKLTFASEGYAVFENGYQYILLSYVGNSKVLTVKDVERVHDYAFFGAKDLCMLKVTTVSQIGRAAFYDCMNLMVLNLGGGDLTVDSEAFYNCEKLVEVIHSGKDTYRKILGGSGFLKVLNDDSPLSHRLRLEEGGFIVFDDVRSGSTSSRGKVLLGYVGDCADVVIPKDVDYIHDYAFYNDEKIKSLTIGSEVAYVGDYAFDGCVNLARVEIETYKKLGNYFYPIEPNPGERPQELYGLYCIGSYSFANCTSLKEILIPETVKIIQEGAFYKCNGLDIFCKISKSNSKYDSSIYSYCDVCWYSSSKPNDEYNYYWHYDENGKIVIWE